MKKIPNLPRRAQLPSAVAKCLSLKGYQLQWPSAANSFASPLDLTEEQRQGLEQRDAGGSGDDLLQKWIRFLDDESRSNGVEEEVLRCHFEEMHRKFTE